MGIEPTYPAWKAGVLPLNYTRISFSYIFYVTASVRRGVYCTLSEEKSQGFSFTSPSRYIKVNIDYLFEEFPIK